MQLFKTTHIDFIGKRKMYYIVSLVITLAGIGAASLRGVEYGIDFEGGIEAAFEFDKPLDIGQLRNAVTAAGFESNEVKSYGDANQYLIRIKHDPDDGAAPVIGKPKETDRLREKLTAAFAGNAVTLLKVDNIGPKIGAELRQDAFTALIVAMIAILLYITFRYELVLGIAAILALLHDVLVTFSFTVICNGLFGLNLEMNQGMLAAFLTVVGFSINDTVINFDRLRENRVLHKGENMMMLVNRSVNETLPRTLLTGVCVVLVLLVLLFFSGEVLRGFAFVMLIGLITGTYSSIFVAGSFVVDWLIYKGKLDPKARRDFRDASTPVIGDRTRSAVARA
ncbi:MAG: protein translocase subunit SecF [bacterium]|nr:protein translocase subunit SecF [Candidatus Kapabacteria bacterium]